jgi:two-component system, NarL family, response regulator
LSHARRIGILIADDHLVVRMGLDSLIGLQDDMCVVAEASSGVEAVELYRSHRPDVTLMDLRMPDLSGADAIEAIRAFDRDARVVVLTVHNGDDTAYRAVRAGARGYLLKDAGSEEILAMVRAVHRGQRRIPPGIASRMIGRIAHEELTPREIEILKLVARGLGNKEIAEALSIRAGTAKNHVAHIIVKMGAHDRTHAVTLALERNIVDLEELAPGRTLA